MKLRLMAVTLILTGAAFAAEKLPLTFSAVLTTGTERRFGVATSGGTRSAWVVLGNEFEGYKLADYDDDAQTLILQRNGQTHRLPIASGNVKTLVSKATLDDATVVLDKMKFEQMMKKQIVSMVSKQMMVQAGGQVPAEEMAALQAKVMEELSAEMKPGELKTDVAKIYAEVFTKEQLRGMSEFYATPAGTALIEKQPMVQEKMLDLIMPRMMKALPRIEEMSAALNPPPQKPSMVINEAYKPTLAPMNSTAPKATAPVAVPVPASTPAPAQPKAAAKKS